LSGQPQRRRVEVSAGVIAQAGKILIAQRRPGDHLSLCWEFPGGKREPGESWEACLRRELLEELGVGVSVGSWIDSVTHAYGDRDVHLRFYRCAIERGTPTALHCHDLRWVEPAALVEFEFPPADARLVRWLATPAGERPALARVTFAPRGHGAAAALDVARGTLLDAAAAGCGARRRSGCGIGRCGACAVDVIAGAERLTPPTAEERAHFTPDAMRAAPRSRSRRRLACQARVAGDVTVALVETALLHF